MFSPMMSFLPVLAHAAIIVMAAIREMLFRKSFIMWLVITSQETPSLLACDKVRNSFSKVNANV